MCLAKKSRKQPQRLREHSDLGADAQTSESFFLISGRAKRETAKGRNRTRNAHFRRFLQIFSSPCKSTDLGVADLRRKPQETVDFRRKPQIFAETVCCLPFGALLSLALLGPQQRALLFVVIHHCSEKPEKAGNVDFKKTPCSAGGDECRPKVPGRFAFPDARFGIIFSAISREFPGRFLANPGTDPGNSHSLLEFSEL